MKKIGKPISKTLLSRTFVWKREIQSQNQFLCKSLLQNENHSVTDICLLCGFQTKIVFEVDSVPYGICDRCVHLQSILRPNEKFIQDVYGLENNNSTSQDLSYVQITQGDLEARIDDIAVPKVDFISKNIVFSEFDLWFDIGSGTGDILVAARKIGFAIQGLDVSINEIKLAEKRAVPTKQMFFDGTQKINEIGNAKVVSLFNVLEHTLHPFSFLSGIVEQMQRSSYLVIEVPRLESLSSLIQYTKPQTHFRHIYPPEHLNIFSDKSMDFCLDSLGLTREATWYFGSDAIETFSYVLNVTQPEFKRGLEEFEPEINLLQANIDMAGLSDVMLLIAKKL